ncbi:MAG: hypothetical protein ACOCWB_07870 [Bacteroidota bacterium]
MKKIITSIIFILVINLLHLRLYAQNTEQDTIKKRDIHTSLTAGYIIGAQIYNDNFLYNPGQIYSLESYIPLSSDLNIGGGLSFLRMQNERFIPVYIDLISYRDKKKNSNFIHAKCGYAYGWNTSVAPMENYEFNGGVFLSLGTGKKININKACSLFIEWAYMHQFAQMSYTVYGSQNYSETINYDMFMISASVLLH